MKEKCIIKFPRTPHLFGSQISGDDISEGEDQTSAILLKNLLVQEKLDGANAGLTFVDNRLIILSRGGPIGEKKTPPQFRYFKSWAHERYVFLREILGNELILFGEWLYFTHSIQYTSLPSYFIIYDIYDKKNSSFWSFDKIVKLLKNTEFSFVPVIFEGIIGNMENLKKLVETKSAFYDGPIEGLYLREENAEKVLGRWKFKRVDFVPGKNFGRGINELK